MGLLLAWILKTQAGKATVIGGTSMLTLVIALHTMAMTEIKSQKIETKTQTVEIKKYVVEKIKDRDEVFKAHVEAFSDKQDTTNTRLDMLTNHLINKK